MVLPSQLARIAASSPQRRDELSFCTRFSVEYAVAKWVRTLREDYSQEPAAAFTNFVGLQLLIIIFLFFSLGRVFGRMLHGGDVCLVLKLGSCEGCVNNW